MNLDVVDSRPFVSVGRRVDANRVAVREPDASGHTPCRRVTVRFSRREVVVCHPPIDLTAVHVPRVQGISGTNRTTEVAATRMEPSRPTRRPPIGRKVVLRRG